MCRDVTITCSALTPCPHSPPQLTWNLQQDSHNKIEQNTDGSFTTKIQQNITLSDTHDGKKISCSARYPVNQGNDTKTAETEETLSVSYSPKDTSASISPSGLVSAGSWVKLTCSSRAKPPVSSFTWFKKSRDGAVKVSEGEIYSFNVTDGGVYYCVATNDLGNQTSAEIHVAIKGFPLWSFLGGILGMMLLCLIIFVWCLKSKHQTQQQTHVRKYSTSLIKSEESVVEEPASKSEGEEENIHYGEISFSVLRNEASSDSVQDRGQQQDTVYAQVKVNKPKNTERADGQGELYAEGASKWVSLYVVKYPAAAVNKDSPWRPNITIPGDLKEKESVTITCSALTPCPHSPPQLTWNLQQDSHNKIEENTDGSFTTKIQQNITLSDTHDGKKISCSARYPVNQGNYTKTAETEETLSVSYSPKDTSASISPSGLVSAGSWVKLTCSSRAKPPVSSQQILSFVLPSRTSTRLTSKEPKGKEDETKVPGHEQKGKNDNTEEQVLFMGEDQMDPTLGSKSQTQPRKDEGRG
ncbi:uncharacterized protein LOC121812839 [Haplochromis burtoni]|uniref:uncharacterized protein LOC121812839 n=1 Tax=Haplochromis burtoni TaxID=8153 RepID=UPI001C2CF2E6|nr:uncharacterized protein LOC121812839 [Haplochromis burtoni]